MPQWSPPLNGGITNAIFTALDALWEPQWSPPLKDGRTLFAWAKRLVTSQPQWSPPLKDGSTTRKIRAVDLGKQVVA